MTEEEKELKKRLKGDYPDMPKGMATAIIKWNKAHPFDEVTDRIIGEVTRIAGLREKNYYALLSSDTEEAYGVLISILSSRELVRLACKNKELERMFERYVFNIQSLRFSEDGKTADDVCPLK